MLQNSSREFFNTALPTAAAMPGAAATPTHHIRLLTPTKDMIDPGKTILDLFMTAAPGSNNKGAQAVWQQFMGSFAGKKPTH